MREPPPLIFSPVPDEQVAGRLADALRRWGAEPFVNRLQWEGRQQLVVGYYARNALESTLLDDLLQEAGLTGPAWRQNGPDEADTSAERLSVAFATRVPQQAQLLTGLLQQAGIESLATDHLAPASAGSDTIQVLVRATDEAGALRVVEQMQTVADGQALAEGEGAETLLAWPQCPGCGTLRETCCPKCKTMGSQWQQADPRYVDPEVALDDDGAGGDEAGHDLLVICPTCDWLFAPRFYRRCAICSHDFGSGIEAEARAVSEAEALNPRVIGVVLALGILLLAVLAYFALLGG